MSTFTGKSGVIEVGAVAVAEVTDFTYTTSIGTTTDESLGDDWVTRKGTKKDWTGSVNANYDHTDTTGQGALTAGDEVTLNLYPVSSEATNNKRSGTVIIKDVAVTNSGNDGIVSVSFNFEGTGAATDTTVV